MARPIIKGESYVGKTGQSMKALGVGAVTKGLLQKNRD
jgi:hypothetical protein